MHRNAPFYIVAPPYDRASAGNRVLYVLGQTLGRLGYEAYMVIRADHAPIARILPAGEVVEYLSPEQADEHFRGGRTPVVIYPETSVDLSPAGVRVFFLLNYLGILGGPDVPPECEMLIAYSANIASQYQDVRHVLYLPVSDPDYWVPDPDVSRDIETVYIGKYIDTIGGELPASLCGAVPIRRRGEGIQTRDEVRALLRRSRVLHVFENTALATEAVLCGCPVVCHYNPTFPNLIAEQEHGTDGFADANADWTKVGVSGFRSAYEKAQARSLAAIAAFAQDAQMMARAKVRTLPFEVRPVTYEG